MKKKKKDLKSYEKQKTKEEAKKRDLDDHRHTNITKQPNNTPQLQLI